MSRYSSGQLAPNVGREATRDAAQESYLLSVAGVQMTLSHRVAMARGVHAALARNWFTGTVAVRAGQLAVISNEVLILNLQLLGCGNDAFSCNEPTPACLEILFDGERCTDQMHGNWELRLFTPRASRIHELICAGGGR